MVETFRIERDSLGEINVPIGALYGAQTQRAVLNFPVSGLHPYRAFIWSVAAIKSAAASVNARLNILDPAIAQAIVTSAQEVMQGQWDEQFVVDPFQAGAGTSHNMNANEVIANRASQILNGQNTRLCINPNDHVNMSQSTNDVIPTAIRLGCLWRFDELVKAVEALEQALLQKGVEFDDIVKSGRTHLQDAVPIRLGQEFTAYGHAVGLDKKRLLNAAENLRTLGIGGTAVGSGLNAHPNYHQLMVETLSQITGLKLYTSTDLFERMQSMADMADFSAAMRTLAITLIRIANDLRLLASGPSTGLDEIRLPALQPGSSIMPGKVNPVMAEMLNMAMYHIMGCDTTVVLAAQAGQLELNVMMPVMAHNLFEMMQIMIGAVNAFTDKCVCGIQANRVKAEGWLEHNAIIITALNPLIGYSVGAELVKESLKRDITVRELAIEKAHQQKLLHRETQQPIPAEEIINIFGNLKKLTEGGIFE